MHLNTRKYTPIAAFYGNDYDSDFLKFRQILRQ